LLEKLGGWAVSHEFEHSIKFQMWWVIGLFYRVSILGCFNFLKQFLITLLASTQLFITKLAAYLNTISDWKRTFFYSQRRF